MARRLRNLLRMVRSFAILGRTLAPRRPVRGGGPVTAEIRTSWYGPIISDAMDMDSTYALHWVGHEPSDELSAMRDQLPPGVTGAPSGCRSRQRQPGASSPA